MRQRVLTVVPAIAMLMLGSCIAEDRDDCPIVENVRLVVVTDYEKEGKTRGAAEKGWYDGQIHGVTVLVFDENDNYVTSWEGGSYTLGEDYVVPLTLPEGHTYHYVAWTNNCQDEYELSYSGEQLHSGMTVDDLAIDLVLPESRTFTADIPHGHYGTLTGASVFDDTTVTDHEIVISPRTYKINYIVRGLATTKGYSVRASDHNTVHTHRGCAWQTLEAELYHHERPLKVGGKTRALSEISASMIMLQIGDDTGTSFELYDTNGNKIYPDPGNSTHQNDILEIIKGAYGFTIPELMDLLENQYEYDIVLTFGAMMDVEISVNGWEYKQQEHDLK